MMIWVIFGVFMLLSLAVSWQLKSRFKKYSLTPLRNGLTGKEVAEKMLREHGIFDVRVISVEGELTDHYDPTKKTVNLSASVYSKSNVAAAAVAAHECGHAIQHANAYAFLTMRSTLVPIVSFASNWVQWVLLAGVLLVNVFPWLLLVGIILFATTTLFSFITLPVEFDASARALKWMDNSLITSDMGQGQARDALRWAALTYVVAAIASLATLLYYIMVFSGSSDD